MVQRGCEYFSDWNRIEKSIAWLQRFVDWRIKCGNTTGMLSAREYETAHNIVKRHVQSEHFHREIDDLRSGKQVLRLSSIICLNLF